MAKYFAVVLPLVFCQMISNISQLNGEVFCPEQEVIFTCMTRDSPSIAWASEEYIEQGGSTLGFDPLDSVGSIQPSPVNPNTVATLTNRFTDTVDGARVLESRLKIITSSNTPTASVACIHGSGSRATVTFHMLIGMYI